MSMNLDSRQRAMLAEIGVRVWQPLTNDSPPGTAAQAAPVPTVAAPAPERAAPQPKPGPRPVTPPPTAAPATVSSDSQIRPLQALPEGLAEMDWQTLKQAAAGCQACALCDNRSHSVFAEGSPAADGQAVDWLIVGDVPGDAEDASGLPFDGPARPLLTAMLQAMGLTSPGGQALPDGVALVSALKCRGSSQRQTSAEEIAQCQPYLARQIALLRPRVILALGRVAAQAVLQTPADAPTTDSLPLGKLRGQVHRAHGSAVIVSYHPAFLLRSPADKARAWADICLGMAQLQAGPG